MQFDLSVYQLSILLIIVLSILAVSVLPKEYSALLFLTYLTVYILVNMFFNFFNRRRIEQYEILNKQLKLNMDIRPKTKFPFSIFFLNKAANFAKYKFGFQWVFPTLSGMYLGQSMEFSVDAVAQEDTERKVHYSNLIVNVTHTGNSCHIRTRTWRDKLRIFKRKRFLTGDATFDEYFQVTTNNADFLIILFDTPIRQLLVNHTYQKATLELDKGQLTFRQRKVMTDMKDRKHFEQVILLLYMIAKRIDHLVDEQQAEQQALPPPEATIEAMEQVEALPEVENEPVEEEVKQVPQEEPEEIYEGEAFPEAEYGDIYEEDEYAEDIDPTLAAELHELIEKGAIEAYPDDAPSTPSPKKKRSFLRLPKFLKRKK